MKLCDECGENPATITSVRSQGEEMIRLRLCDQCQADGEKEGAPQLVLSTGSSFGPSYDNASFDNFYHKPEDEVFRAFNRIQRRGDENRGFLVSEISAFKEMHDALYNSFTGMIENGGGGRIFLSAQAGTGKTHLLAACERYAKSKGLRVSCITIYDFVSQMISTFSEKPSSEKRMQSQIISDLSDKDVVLIDDLNPEVFSESSPRYIGWLLMELCRRRIVVVIASQMRLKTLALERIGPRPGLGEAIVDRIRSHPFAFIGLPEMKYSYRHLQSILYKHGEL